MGINVFKEGCYLLGGLGEICVIKAYPPCSKKLGIRDGVGARPRLVGCIYKVDNCEDQWA